MSSEQMEREAFDNGFSSGICLTLAYFNSAGDACSTAYEEILKAANEEKVIAYARKEGEMRWTGLDKWCRYKKQRDGYRRVPHRRSASDGDDD